MSQAKPARGEILSLNPNLMPRLPSRVRRDLFLVGAQAEVERQVRPDRPRVLQEQAEAVGVDVAGVVDARHRVVTVGAAHAAAVERVARRAPVQVDRRELRAAEPRVADALVLEAGLDRVLAPLVGVIRQVGVHRVALEVVELGDAARREVGVAVDEAQRVGNLGEVEARALEVRRAERRGAAASPAPPPCVP